MVGSLFKKIVFGRITLSIASDENSDSPIGVPHHPRRGGKDHGRGAMHGDVGGRESRSLSSHLC
jgi:hypothetical protein